MVLSMGREEIKGRERDKREENNCLGKKRKNGNLLLVKGLPLRDGRSHLR